MLLTRLIGRLAPTELLAATTTSPSSSLLSSSSSILESTRARAYLSTKTETEIEIKTAAKPTPKPNAIITIEDSCLKRLREILEKPNEEFLRINVETGGCSGFSYMFDIENNLDPNEDLIFERDSYKVVINKEILPYMKGSAIEYNESLIKSSFQVKNPIAETKCSCGASFSIDPNKIK